MKQFEELGFHQVREIVNKYGIKVIIGTDYNNDWCLHIPYNVVKICHNKEVADMWGTSGLNFYLISKEETYKKAEKYTRSMDTHNKRLQNDKWYRENYHLYNK